jgi:hypothetical protein
MKRSRIVIAELPILLSASNCEREVKKLKPVLDWFVHTLVLIARDLPFNR